MRVENNNDCPQNCTFLTDKVSTYDALMKKISKSNRKISQDLASEVYLEKRDAINEMIGKHWPQLEGRWKG